MILAGISKYFVCHINQRGPASQCILTCAALAMFLAVSAAFGEPAESVRRIPLIDPGLRTGPEREARELEQQKRISEIESDASRVRSELDVARASGTDTSLLEEKLAKLADQKRAVYKRPGWDPVEMAFPALREKTAEVQQIADSEAAISASDAARVLEYLYIDVHPKLNQNLQMYVFNVITDCCEKGRVTEDAHVVFRNGVLDYFNATRDQCDSKNQGPMCNPQAMFFLANAICSSANTGDQESIEAFRHLKESMAVKCESLQWHREKNVMTGVLVELEESLTISDNQLQGVKKLGDESLSEDDIAKLLRHYQRVLRMPSRRVPGGVVQVIGCNLISISKKDLSEKTWGIWFDDVLAMGPRRASPELRDLVLSIGKKSLGGRPVSASKRVIQVFERESGGHERKVPSAQN